METKALKKMTTGRTLMERKEFIRDTRSTVVQNSLGFAGLLIIMVIYEYSNWINTSTIKSCYKLCPVKQNKR